MKKTFTVFILVKFYVLTFFLIFERFYYLKMLIKMRLKIVFY